MHAHGEKSIKFSSNIIKQELKKQIPQINPKALKIMAKIKKSRVSD
jgi:hypothetical protein